MAHFALKLTDVEIMKNLFFYFLVVAFIILALVIFFVFYYIIKYRARKSTGTPPQNSSDSELIEWILGGIATITVGVFAYLSIVAMGEIQNIPEDPQPFVVITGHQWWWEAQYPGSGAVTANQIHIPVGKRILLQVNSADVIHDWWVPELGRKMDMIPGIDNYMWFYAEKEGEYLGTCSEFCGAQHGLMRIRVTALKDADFKAWEQRQLALAVPPSDSLSLEGKRLFLAKTCTNCHMIDGVGGIENIGPNLTHFASRKRFLADMEENTEENLRAWLKDPQKVKPWAKMPDFNFSEEELNALVAYIHGLK